MLALSIRQPWAWLIVQGYKPVENREWSTAFRGRFQIHASKTMSRADYEACRIFIDGFASIALPAPEDLFRGGLVGEAELVDCVTTLASPWFVGPFGFVLRNAKPIPPVALKGALGFFDPYKQLPLFQPPNDPPRIGKIPFSGSGNNQRCKQKLSWTAECGGGSGDGVANCKA